MVFIAYMLDDAIIGEILERERRKRKDSGWQPIPLYKELELPQPAPQKQENSPSEPLEIDILGLEVEYNLTEYNIIQTCSYNSFSKYQ